MGCARQNTCDKEGLNAGTQSATWRADASRASRIACSRSSTYGILGFSAPPSHKDRTFPFKIRENGTELSKRLVGTFDAILAVALCMSRWQCSAGTEGVADGLWVGIRRMNTG